MAYGPPLALKLSDVFQLAGDGGGAQAALTLRPLLAADQYTAVGVLHGTGADADYAYERYAPRLSEGLGLVWVDQPQLLAALEGDRADDLRAALAPLAGMLMTFFAPLTGRTNWGLAWNEVDMAAFDQGLNQARTDR